MGGLYKKAILRLNFVLMLFIILYNNISIAYAVENTTTENNDIDMYDYSNIDEAINDAGYSGSFEDILKIIYGDYSTQNTNNSFKNKLIRIFDEVIGYAIKSNKMTVVQIILLALFYTVIWKRPSIRNSADGY